ncbi:carbohydrate-binding family 9-like protein [Aestuariimicrobium sp. p3-SID1156]|uniref:carbohydrate-binding family 9-like protein n=1 Tax=Aestuariimicrobium sp. p3-SID1156 TaxID=2916038 RepID=UPI00223AC6B9|nr:carbohydrate-binding family 9-like protein [Aestuariimicrobium sp. p3-SID1156]MCT1458480.1 carbohydrate-binding family 9-like protein [Aestuariimicrobium sp. p3-SID1156]
MNEQRSLVAPGRAEVDTTLWTAPGSVPATHAILSWTPEALTCRMVCAEVEPRATYTRPNDPVHKDSCLEWFLAPWPGTGLYLNLEANALGTFYAAFGTVADREFLTPEQRLLVGCRADVEEGQWSITWTVPAELLSALAEVAGREPVELTAGTIMEANFYKCGDDTEVEHYGAWNPITAETPAFHRPEEFGRLELA